MSLLTVGVFGTSQMENENRVPIHPGQLGWIDEEVRQHLFFEEDYGEPFGVENDKITSVTGGMLSRNELFEKCDILLMPKPILADFQAMKEGSILWGWPHCVQQKKITQEAIDRRMTLIAWEAMHKWSSSGAWQMHIFHKNNEIAGYASILHAVGLLGIDGNYGPPRKVVVISFGSVSRGAINALHGLGFHDISVFTQRHSVYVADQIPSVKYFHFEETDSGELISLHPDRHSMPFIDELAEADVIINGTLQNTDHPLMFVDEKGIDKLKPESVIIDVSCDEGMGFYFARPTSFEEPMLKFKQVYYYAVDHTPSYLWRSASWAISTSILPYLPVVMQGEERWEESETISRAIEIKKGEIQNPKILTFQKREEEYPHKMIK
jgi:N5-(carboxyethyl)ornithine synthase